MSNHLRDLWNWWQSLPNVDAGIVILVAMMIMFIVTALVMKLLGY